MLPHNIPAFSNRLTQLVPLVAIMVPKMLPQLTVARLRTMTSLHSKMDVPGNFACTFKALNFCGTKLLRMANCESLVLQKFRSIRYIQLGDLMDGKRAEKTRQRKRYYEKEVETVTGSGVMKKDQELKRKGIRKLWGTGRLIHACRSKKFEGK